MFSLTDSHRYWYYNRPTDMRKSFHTLGGIVTDVMKRDPYMYHLPFYRQIQQYREYGVSLNDSTVGGWYEAAVEKLKLLYDLLRHKKLSSEYIQVDESVIPVLDDEKHRARKGYEWCVRDGLTGDVMFYYDRGSRSGRVARELLGLAVP